MVSLPLFGATGSLLFPAAPLGFGTFLSTRGFALSRRTLGPCYDSSGSLPQYPSNSGRASYAFTCILTGCIRKT